MERITRIYLPERNSLKVPLLVQMMQLMRRARHTRLLELLPIASLEQRKPRASRTMSELWITRATKSLSVAQLRLLAWSPAATGKNFAVSACVAFPAGRQHTQKRQKSLI